MGIYNVSGAFIFYTVLIDARVCVAGGT